VLKSVEISLAGFQRDLGVVSTEIETLQTRSTALNTRLENRKVVEALLGPAVEEISIAPAVVKSISDGQIDDNWLKALTELQKRIKIIEGKSNASESIKAVSDIKPLLEGLTTKVNFPPYSK
jgi:vacuolar protein sorting-associated protein 52